MFPNKCGFLNYPSTILDASIFLLTWVLGCLAYMSLLGLRVHPCVPCPLGAASVWVQPMGGVHKGVQGKGENKALP